MKRYEKFFKEEHNKYGEGSLALEIVENINFIKQLKDFNIEK
jgi:hypothetical protein